MKTATDKRCKTCDQKKPAAEFWRTHATADLLTANCRACIVANAERDRAEREARRAAADAKKSKPCMTCGETKSLTAFAPNRNASDGRRRVCNSCIASELVGTKSRTPSDEAKARDRARRISERGRKVSRDCAKAWRKENPEAVLAQKAVAVAIRRGVLARPQGCQILGCSYKGKPHAHHFDHLLPLQILWCCGRHHKMLHAGANLAIVPGLPEDLLRVPGQQRVENSAAGQQH